VAAMIVGVLPMIVRSPTPESSQKQTGHEQIVLMQVGK
jgi:hypothetical protein